MTAITTAHVGTNAPLFANILRLYVPDGSMVADLTYGLGNFWRTDGLPERYRLVTMDMERPTTVRGDLRCTPFTSGVFDAVVLDPPYANNGGEHTEDGGIHRTYNLKQGLSTAKIWALYSAGITEGERILRQGGVLIVKCQDAIEGSRQHRTTIHVWQEAMRLGMEDVDQFVLVRQGTPPMRHPYQHHARKAHSVFWVFRRQRSEQMPLL